MPATLKCFQNFGNRGVINSVLFFIMRHAKKVVSDGLGLVDFAIGLVIFVLNLPNGQVSFFGKFKLQKDCNQSC